MQGLLGICANTYIETSAHTYLYKFLYVGFAKNWGYLLACPYSKDCTFGGLYWGPITDLSYVRVCAHVNLYSCRLVPDFWQLELWRTPFLEPLHCGFKT